MVGMKLQNPKKETQKASLVCRIDGWYAVNSMGVIEPSVTS